MKNILIYFPYNRRTIEQQSVMELLVKQNNRVFLLTLAPENELHENVRKFGVEAYASPEEAALSVKSVYRNAVYLAKFCKQKKIDIIIVHQQLSAIPYIFASPFISAKAYYVRHNADEDYITHPRKAKWLNRFVNRMMPTIIAPSDVVYRFMTETERVPEKKISRINYGYNFSLYDQPDFENVQRIRQEHAASLLIISIARLTPVKRHYLMFAVVKQLLDKGLDVKMICLGDGPSREEIEQWVANNNMQQSVFFKGIRPNIFDYLVAGDLLLHLSETEASNSVVKEAGLAGKTVIVCKDVGDFSDYIVDGENGFLTKRHDPIPEAVLALEKLYNNKQMAISMGQKLHDKITHTFDINNVADKYNNLVNSSR